MGTLPCFHVTTSDGSIYGVAATSIRDALLLAQDRINQDGGASVPVRAVRVGRWGASYGTVLAY